MIDGSVISAAIELAFSLVEWAWPDHEHQRVPLAVYKVWATLGFTSDDTFTSGTGLVEGVRLGFVTERSASVDCPPFLVVRSPVHRDVAVTFDAEVLARSSTDPATGDPAFDAVVRIGSGDLPRAFALLDPPTREAVRAAVQAGATRRRVRSTPCSSACTAIGRRACAGARSACCWPRTA